ncbi:hypothetical protein [Insolitispirillum peregrinum]|uniref:hypothetical protein n=1 Tax=Insolitispirillum peregrinum TaxID=80876 RepID=UPI00361EFB12
MADWRSKGFEKISSVVGTTKKVVGTTKDVIDTTKDIVGATRKRGQDLGDVARRAGQGISEKASKVSEILSNAVEEYTPEIVRDASGRVSERIDILTGNALLDMVQDMLFLQEQYNDVLAAKLEEALTRIEILEAALAQKKGDPE